MTGADVSSAFEATISVANQIHQTGTVPNNHTIWITLPSTRVRSGVLFG